MIGLGPWLLIQLAKLRKPEKPPERSRGLGEMTEWERRHIQQAGKCPDCGTGGLLGGPQGGLCMNVKCDNCGVQLCIAFSGDGTLYFAERIAESTQVPVPGPEKKA